MREAKVRPTFTPSEMLLISQCIEQRIGKHVAAGDYGNPVLMQLTKLKQYCDSFAKAWKSPEEQMREMLAKMGISSATLAQAQQMTMAGQTEMPKSSQPTTTDDSPVLQTYESPLDNPYINDEQKYELLKIKGLENFSKEEEMFYLNVGVARDIKRMQNKKLGEGDL